jgi:kojibiose phosphorylase
MDTISIKFAFKMSFEEEPLTIAEQGIIWLREREIESVLSLGNGYIGTRNSLEEHYGLCSPGVFTAGFYDQSNNDRYNFIVKIPDWTRIRINIDDDLIDLIEPETVYHNRYIDLKNGTAVREWKNVEHGGRITDIKIIKYISLAEKKEMGKCLIIKPENYSGNIRVLSGFDENASNRNYLENFNYDMEDKVALYLKTKYSNKKIFMAQKSVFESSDNVKVLNYTEKITSGTYEVFEWMARMETYYIIKSSCLIDSEIDESKDISFVMSNFYNQEKNFFDINLKKHNDVWNQRWLESRITIQGNSYDQKLVDFAVYHLIKSGEFSGNNVSIPARELSGESYKGHVFWDTEMFVLPFFIYTKPEIARALLMYRYNTLDGARINASKEGFEGASYAWESTDSGLEMAPEFALLPNGEVIPIYSGIYEIHISPDIAYAVWNYWQATDDNEFITDFGAEIIFETARYCKSLIKKEYDGFYHIKKVIGPDEYHELVNDNAYTNYLIANNFDIAINTFEFLKKYPEKYLILKEKINLSEEETDLWKEFKEKIYTGFNPETGLFEQFKGYFDLEYIDLKDYESRNVPMDIILGRQRVQSSQVTKQADVLMLLFLFGERFSKKIAEANYNYYEKRCGHGSSLSPSVHSIIASRTGKKEHGYKYFLQNSQIDIGDSFGNASGGIHIGAIGGTWMISVMGFAGMYPTKKGLVFEPCLPDEWRRIEFKIMWKNQNIFVTISHLEMKFNISGKNPVWISAGFENWLCLNPDKDYNSILINETWQWKE